MRFSRVALTCPAAVLGIVCLVSCSGGSASPHAATSSPGTKHVPTLSECRYHGVRVACSNQGGEFDVQSGCYIQRMNPAAVPSGPIRREYEANGGAIVRVSDCLDGQLWRYMWVSSASGSAPVSPPASSSGSAPAS